LLDLIEHHLQYSCALAFTHIIRIIHIWYHNNLEHKLKANHKGKIKLNYKLQLKTKYKMTTKQEKKLKEMETTK
jgi:hypothetical protein